MLQTPRILVLSLYYDRSLAKGVDTRFLESSILQADRNVVSQFEP
jgi:hypothetical protein